MALRTAMMMQLLTQCLRF